MKSPKIVLIELDGFMAKAKIETFLSHSAVRGSSDAC